MKILFISTKSPDDHTCGGGVRSGFMLRALQELGDVTTVSGTLKAVKTRLPWFMMIPFMFSRRLMDRLYRDRKGILKELGQEGKSFDCVVVRYVGPMNSNAAWKIAPCFLDIDDLPSQAAATLRVNEPWWKRVLLVALLRVWQARLIRRSTAFWVCNAEQMPVLEKYGMCSVLPNVAEPPGEGYEYGRVSSTNFLTVGGMSYHANSDGVDWFVDNVWPLVKARHPDAVYNIVGGGAPKKLAEKWANADGVRVWGFVDDLATQYEAACAVIAPIFTGAGTCIKVLEAALHGRKVFATPFGARGLNNEECDKLGVLRCSSIESFVDEIDKYLARDSHDRSSLQVAIAREAKDAVSYRRFADTVKNLILNGMAQCV